MPRSKERVAKHREYMREVMRAKRAAGYVEPARKKKHTPTGRPRGRPETWADPLEAEFRGKLLRLQTWFRWIRLGMGYEVDR